MPADDDILHILVDLVRDQGKVLAEIATGTAVTADRLVQISATNAKMADAITRLDEYLDRQNTANATVRASADAAVVEERAALTRLYDALSKGLQSSSVQRLLSTLTIIATGLLYAHFNLVAPVATPGAVP